jgi:cell division protein ZapD
MVNSIIYEQPLNERVRSFLRLEYLFMIVNHHVSNFNEWDNRTTITSLLNIVDLISRSDIKTDLIKELERHSNTLTALADNPNVDNERLQNILGNIIKILESLRDSSYQPGQALRQNELITSIKQRSTIPGGACNFDLPRYHYWLHKSVEERINDIKLWHGDLQTLHDALRLTLHMIRNSATPVIERATSGFYQKPIESNLACQLIRIALPKDSKYYPEISGGKHRFTVRFMEQNSTTSRPVQTQDNVEFEMHCCIL